MQSDSGFYIHDYVVCWWSVRSMGAGAEEAADWEEARCGYAEEMRRFIKKYPDSEYRDEAEGCLILLLLNNCKVYLESGRLTGEAGGNAHDCFEEVLALDSVMQLRYQG